MKNKKSLTGIVSLLAVSMAFSLSAGATEIGVLGVFANVFAVGLKEMSAQAVPLRASIQQTNQKAADQVRINNALLEAASNDDRDAVQYLLSRGADVNAKDGNGNTVLMMAVLARDHVLVATLLNNRADVNAKDPFGWTPLIDAVVVRDRFLVVALLNNGADLNAKDNAGKNAFDHALDRNLPKILNYLMAHGAMP